ncbi:WD repeat-containing protein, putative [Plasmodium vinckei]|uniref:WD repeat-containing protein, putative n=1 Tax=Plasmodium vinckei TaxID=5860 RepID=A0A6V7TAE8_PLAVN|nr:WD repeat-containing protein, putative [Plasmodium vinckei]
MNSIKRICANHGVKCIHFLSPNLVCISFGNIIKIINIINKDILLEYAVSNSSNIYGLIYKKYEEDRGILICHGVHKIYAYKLCINNYKCTLKLLSKYCLNKWILKIKFLNCINKKDYTLIICLSNGSAVLLDIYNRMILQKWKFNDIFLLYSADIYIKKKKKDYKVIIAGGTPFNKILLWSIIIAKKNKENEKKKSIISLEHYQELKGHRGIIFKVKFFKKSKYLGSVSDDREGIIWSKVMGEENNRKIKREYNEELAEMNYNNKYNQNESTNFLLYYKIDTVLTGHDARVWDIEMCKHKNKIYFVTCSEDSTCIIYELKNKIKPNDINNKNVCRQTGISFKYSSTCSGSIRFILFNPTYRILLSGFDNGSVHFVSFYKLIKNNSKINSITNEEVNNENKPEQTCEQSSNLCYYDEQFLKKKNMINFLDDSLNKELEKTNDWVRSINHINMTNIIICTNFGKIYILKASEIKNRLTLLHKIEDKNCLLTCLTFYGLNYICLGFSNGYSSFLLLSNNNLANSNIIFSKYFKCFSHRVSDINIIPLSTLSYKKIVASDEYKNLVDILYLNLKKGASNNTKQGISNFNNATSDNSTFYKVMYNSEMEADYERHKMEPLASNFLLTTFDHTGNIKFFGIQNEDGKINFFEISETFIDVKNKKSKIISFNYALREKQTKQESQNSLNIIIFLGDEYGCIFIIYLKIPIQIYEKKRIYDFANFTIKYKDKLRVHGNRKVFDIKIIDGFIYSCGQNGNIIKYQLYKNKIYTLYKLCLIKIPYYSSIYKLIPIFINTTKGAETEPTYRGNENGVLTSEPADNTTYSQEDNIHNMVVCCFKEKKFVLYDLKNKIEYISVECGGFRRPLSIFMKYTNNLMKTFSFCFCKEKNIFFYFKELNQSKSNIIPYNQIYINPDFHTKSISSILWINKNYFVTCSEDGTIKILFIKRIKQNQESKPYVLDPKKDLQTNAKKKYNNKNYMQHQIEVVQNVYNHNEPIFSICFLKNSFYNFQSLRFLASVGAKNSINLFYIFMNNNKIPIIYHIEKLKVPIFSSNLRFLCVEGTYQISDQTENNYVIHFDIFIGTSMGHIFRYNNGIYEFKIYKNIVFSKIQKRASLTNSYNLHSTILSISLTNIFTNKKNASYKLKEVQSINDKLKGVQNNLLTESNIETDNNIPSDMTQKLDPNELHLLVKKKKKKWYDNEIHNILVSGLNNGYVYIYHAEEDKMNLLKKIKAHQNGINKIAIKKKNNILHIFTCGDDQSINILTIKIKNKIKEFEIIKNENSTNKINQEMTNNCNIQKRFKIFILQNTNMPNSHYSSIRSIINYSNFVITTSWDQYISIWKINKYDARKLSNKNKNENKNKHIIALSNFKKFKMAVYDVSCLNYLVIKKKNILKNGENNQQNYNRKVYLSVAGTNGSIECFLLSLTK